MCSLTGGLRASLTVIEWSMLEDIVQILKPLEEATRELCVEKTVLSKKSDPSTLHELQKHVTDDNKTQVTESQDSSTLICD